jgi:hypothetical protein
MGSSGRSITGPNFAVEERVDGIAIVRVWRRPDLSRDEGGRCAALIVEHMRRLARSFRSCVFDLTEATTAWGPATNQSLSEMLAVWESAGKPIFIVPADEAIQRLLLVELQRSSAPQWSKLVATRDAAVRQLARPDPSGSGSFGRNR